MVEVTRVDGFLVDHANAPGGKQFRFTPENLRRFRGYLDLLAENYDPDLLDPESVIREELKLTKLGHYATPHVIMVAEDEINLLKGTDETTTSVVAAASGNMMPIKMGDEPKDRSAFGILSYSPPERMHVENNPTYKAVHHLEGELQTLARQRKRDYAGMVVEAEPAKVDIYASWLFKVLEGVPYVQPVLDWKRDGTPAKQPVELPLMARITVVSDLGSRILADERLSGDLTRDFALEVVNALYDWTIPSSDEFNFRDGRAERNAVQYHEEMRVKILDAVADETHQVRLV